MTVYDQKFQDARVDAFKNKMQQAIEIHIDRCLGENPDYESSARTVLAYRDHCLRCVNAIRQEELKL